MYYYVFESNKEYFYIFISLIALVECIFQNQIVTFVPTLRLTRLTRFAFKMTLSPS